MIQVAPDEKIVTSCSGVWMGQAPSEEPSLAALCITLASASLFSLLADSLWGVMPNAQLLLKCNLVCIINERK